MNNLNSVLIEGNMVRDPLIRSTPKGTQVCNFSIASNRFFRQDSNLEKETGFFEIEAWGKLASACSTQGRKGRGVRVVGRLKQDRWTGSDGKSHNKVAIVAEHVEYRSDFKKSDETVSETDNLADAAFFNGEFNPNGEAGGFSGHSEENVEVEVLQAVSF
jgi:single-strand DNA-binding protein